MGFIISALGGLAESALGAITGNLANPQRSTQELQGVSNGLTSPALAAHLDVFAFDPAPDFMTTLKATMKKAQSSIIAAFPTIFPGDVIGSNVDYGVINNYCGGGSSIDLSGLITQITTDFTNWQVAVSTDQINAMAKTLATQVNSQLGAAGMSHGTFSITMNESLDWMVAYGEFSITPTTTGLVYAFGAVLNTGGFSDK